jgi:hypothetical protein
MRLVVGVLSAVLLAAACGGRSTAVPAWPKQSDKEVDGGESLEPRTASAIAAVEDEKEDVVEAKPVEKPAEPPAAVEPTPSTPTPPTPPEESITTEEIVIEIEED